MGSSDVDYNSDHDAAGNLISPDYGYLPTKTANLVFISLFALSTAVHILQSFRSRAWWLLPTVVLAGFGEVLGWIAREWSHDQPLNDNAFLMQTVALILSPTPLVGALFITFGRMSARLGQRYSRLSPRLYSRIFLTCDIVALFIQAAGGGIAASTDNVKTSRMGSNIMLAGIVFQLVSLTVFSTLLVEYLVRRHQDRPFSRSTVDETEYARVSVDSLKGPSLRHQKSMMRLAIALCIGTTFLYIRAIYRTVELADGWTGKVIQTQSLFIVFDGVMVFSTMLILNICHPGLILRAPPEPQAPEETVPMYQT
ncbi:RTA1 like protein-domain-containing protein [Cubamyces lactineus]|nr:RTA1 like protein-domain-containing protein [Cubamyces lactineus]